MGIEIAAMLFKKTHFNIDVLCDNFESRQIFFVCLYTCPLICLLMVTKITFG